MANCNKCGAEINPGAIYCQQCGCQVDTWQTVQNPQSPGGYQPNVAAGPNVDTTGYLVWSIINTICCCLPLGIVGIVYSSKAKSARTAEEARKIIKNTQIICIIGTVIGFLATIGLFACGVLGQIFSEL